MPLLALFGHHFQIAYVVHDTQAAVRVFADHFGIPKWRTMDMIAAYGEQAPMRAISLAYSGDVMIELIEENQGVPSLYAGWLAGSNDGIRLHHLGFLLPSAEEFEASSRQLERAGFPAAVAGTTGDQLDFHYADTTAVLGHYYELVHLRPAGAAFFAGTPRN